MQDANISMERRVSPRITVNIPVKFRVLEDEGEIVTVFVNRAREKNGRALDLSLGGMQINSDLPLKTGNVLNFEIFLPGLSEVLTAFAEVVWADGTIGGLHFLEMKQEDFGVLKAYLHKASKSR